MEVYLPMIQTILLDWYRLTLENKEYAGCLAIAVWLVTAVFYSIRISFLKRTNAINLKARMELKAGLDSAQQQLQGLQEQLAANTQELEAAQATVVSELQRAAQAEQKIEQGNRQLIDSIKNLASNFELSEPTLPAASNLDSTPLWQSYAAIAAQIADRFKAEQQAKTELQLSLWAETSKLAEKDALLGPLQLRLESQTEQLAKLELAVEEQKILREREQVNAEKLLAETLQKHQAEAARSASAVAQSVVQPAPKISVAEAPLIQPRPVEIVEPVIVQAPAPAPIEPPKVVTAEPAPIVEKPVAAAPVQASAKQSSVDKLAQKNGGFGKFKQMLNNTMQQVAKFDQKLGTVAEQPIAEQIEQIVEPVTQAVAEIQASAVALEQAAVETVKETTAGAGSKLKSLFGKSKPAEAVIAAVAVAEPEPVVEAAAAESAVAKAGLKGLLKKWK